MLVLASYDVTIVPSGRRPTTLSYDALGRPRGKLLERSRKRGKDRIGLRLSVHAKKLRDTFKTRLREWYKRQFKPDMAIDMLCEELWYGAILLSLAVAEVGVDALMELNNGCLQIALGKYQRKFTCGRTSQETFGS